MCCMVYLQTPTSIFLVLVFVLVLMWWSFLFWFWHNDLDCCLPVFRLELLLAECLALRETWVPLRLAPGPWHPPTPSVWAGTFWLACRHPHQAGSALPCLKVKGPWLWRFSWAWLPGSTMARCTSASRMDSAFVCPGGKMGKGPSLYLSFFLKKFIVWNV